MHYKINLKIHIKEYKSLDIFDAQEMQKSLNYINYNGWCINHGTKFKFILRRYKMIAWFDFYVYTNLWICFLLLQNNAVMRLNKAGGEFFRKRLENFVNNPKLKQCEVVVHFVKKGVARHSTYRL